MPWCFFYTNGRNILVPFPFRAVQGPAVTKRKVSPIRLCDLRVFKNALCRWKVAVCCPAPWLEMLESFWVSLPTWKVMVAQHATHCQATACQKNPDVCTSTGCASVLKQRDLGHMRARKHLEASLLPFGTLDSQHTWLLPPFFLKMCVFNLCA